MRTHRRAIQGGAWLCLLWLTSGCRGGDRSPTKTPESAKPNRVVIGVKADVGSFNVYTATNAFTQEIADLLYARLAEEQDDFREGPPTLRPALARSWKLSEDRKTLALELEPAARWSDGRSVTPEDVVFSERAAASPQVGWVGSDTKEQIAEVRVAGPGTVELRFSRAYPYQLLDAVEGNVLPEHVFGKVPLADWPKTSFDEAPVSSGPFRLVRHEPGASISLARNPSYFRAPLPRLDEVVFRILPDVETLLNELATGGIDVMENVPPEAASRVEALPGVRLVRAPDLAYTFVCWNTAKPLFSDPRVRRALTLAIDRDAIIETLLPAVGRRADSPIPSILWAHHPALDPLPYDASEAKRLLAEAGFRDTDGDGRLDRNGRPFRFELETNRESALRQRVVEMIVENLRRVGIEAVPRTYEYGSFVGKHEKHDFDAFVSGLRESTKVDLKSALHSDAREHGYNYGLYRSPELDDLIDRARVENDPERARTLWRRAQEIVTRDQPLTFLFEQDRLHAVPQALAGFRPTPRTAYAGLEEWHWEESR